MSHKMWVVATNRLFAEMKCKNFCWGSGRLLLIFISWLFLEDNDKKIWLKIRTIIAIFLTSFFKVYLFRQKFWIDKNLHQIFTFKFKWHTSDSTNILTALKNNKQLDKWVERLFQNIKSLNTHNFMQYLQQKFVNLIFTKQNNLQTSKQTQNFCTLI